MQDIAGALGNISKTPLKEDRGVGGWEEGGGGGWEDTCSGLLQAPPASPAPLQGGNTWLSEPGSLPTAQPLAPLLALATAEPL